MMNSTLTRVAFVCAAGLILGCKPKIPDYPYNKEPDPRTAEFVLGVSDVVKVNVWKNPQMSGTVTIRPDGTITVPLVGDVVAGGRTPSQLRDAIAEQVKKFVRVQAEEVVVQVSEINSYRFTVTGEVAREGMFSSTSYVTVAQALALAGGFSRFAKRNKIILTRRGTDGKLKRIPIIYDAIADGTHPEMNLVIVAGDSLHVP